MTVHLSAEDRQEIRRLWLSGRYATRQELAADFQVHASVVTRLLHDLPRRPAPVSDPRGSGLLRLAEVIPGKSTLYIDPGSPLEQQLLSRGRGPDAEYIAWGRLIAVAYDLEPEELRLLLADDPDSAPEVTEPRGQPGRPARFSAKEVASIRALHGAGTSIRALAARFSSDRNSIRRVLRGTLKTKPRSHQLQLRKHMKKKLYQDAEEFLALRKLYREQVQAAVARYRADLALFARTYCGDSEPSTIRWLESSEEAMATLSLWIAAGRPTTASTGKHMKTRRLA